ANGDVPPGAGETVELLACRDRRGMIEAYDRLLSDAMAGDALLFAREDEVENAWRIVDPVLRSPVPVEEYEPNTWGPVAADPLAAPWGGGPARGARFCWGASPSPGPRAMGRGMRRPSLPTPRAARSLSGVRSRSRSRAATRRGVCTSGWPPTPRSIGRA